MDKSEPSKSSWSSVNSPRSLRIKSEESILREGVEEDYVSKKVESPAGTLCHKLHSACISTTSGLIFTN